MKREERSLKHIPMLNYLKNYTATTWAENFIHALSSIQIKNRKAKLIKVQENSVELPEEIIKKTKNKRITLFLDYDGTLVPICDNPEDARMKEPYLKKIKKLIKNPMIKLVLVSGRPKEFLHSQFSKFGIDMAAEHGAVSFSVRKNEWTSLVRSNIKTWYRMVGEIMQAYTSHVPGSFLEKKQYSVSWHYRKSPQEFAVYQANKLKEELNIGLSNLPVTILEGNKVIETRCIEANKGFFLNGYLAQESFLEPNTPFAIGDDLTDEEMFAALPKNGISIKVGSLTGNAKFRLESQEKVFPFLEKLSELTDG